MRMLVISDVHANYPALRAVAADAPAVDVTVCCGDLVGLGGFPRATVSWMQEHTQYCLAGNHDRAVIYWGEGHVNDEALSMYERNHTLSMLGMDAQSWVVDNPSYTVDKDVGMICAHAKPAPAEASGLEPGNRGVPPSDFVTVAASMPEWVSLVLLGHTHEQHAIDSSQFDGDHDVTVVNPGSVGQPLDSGCAEYAVVDTDTREVDLRTAEYDTDPVKARLDEHGVATHHWGWS